MKSLIGVIGTRSELSRAVSRLYIIQTEERREEASPVAIERTGSGVCTRGQDKDRTRTG